MAATSKENLDPTRSPRRISSVCFGWLFRTREVHLVYKKPQNEAICVPPLISKCSPLVRLIYSPLVVFAHFLLLSCSVTTQLYPLHPPQPIYHLQVQANGYYLTSRRRSPLRSGVCPFFRPCSPWRIQDLRLLPTGTWQTMAIGDMQHLLCI